MEEVAAAAVAREWHFFVYCEPRILNGAHLHLRKCRRPLRPLFARAGRSGEGRRIFLSATFLAPTASARNAPVGASFKRRARAVLCYSILEHNFLIFPRSSFPEPRIGISSTLKTCFGIHKFGNPASVSSLRNCGISMSIVDRSTSASPFASSIFEPIATRGSSESWPPRLPCAVPSPRLFLKSATGAL